MAALTPQGDSDAGHGDVRRRCHAGRDRPAGDDSPVGAPLEGWLPARHGGAGEQGSVVTTAVHVQRSRRPSWRRCSTGSRPRAPDRNPDRAADRAEVPHTIQHRCDRQIAAPAGLDRRLDRHQARESYPAGDSSWSQERAAQKAAGLSNRVSGCPIAGFAPASGSRIGARLIAQRACLAGPATEPALARSFGSRHVPAAGSAVAHSLSRPVLASETALLNRSARACLTRPHHRTSDYPSARATPCSGRRIGGRPIAQFTCAGNRIGVSRWLSVRLPHSPRPPDQRPSNRSGRAVFRRPDRWSPDRLVHPCWPPNRRSAIAPREPVSLAPAAGPGSVRSLGAPAIPAPCCRIGGRLVVRRRRVLPDAQGANVPW